MNYYIEESFEHICIEVLTVYSSRHEKNLWRAYVG